MLADAGADIFRGTGNGSPREMGRRPRLLPGPPSTPHGYNAQRAEWHHEIQATWRPQAGGQPALVWGKGLPNGSAEEFDEDCSTKLRDLTAYFPAISQQTRISPMQTQTSMGSRRTLASDGKTAKSIPFGQKSHIWVSGGTCTPREVHLPDEKKARYLAAIAEWKKKRTHNLLETQRLIRQATARSAGHPCRTSSPHQLGGHARLFQQQSFPPAHPSPRHPGRPGLVADTSLASTIIVIPIPRPTHPSPSTEPTRTQAQALAWQSRLAHDGERGDWPPDGSPKDGTSSGPKPVGFELLAICLCALSGKGEHIVVYGDNRGVVEGWWKRCSANKPTNHVFRRILQFSEDRGERYTQDMSRAHKTPPMPLPGASTPPAPSCLSPITVPVRSGPSSSTSDPGELARSAAVRHLVRMQDPESGHPGHQ